jgi:hypothetical protein
MSRPQNRCRCRCCHEFFFPDRRTAERQKCCSKPACRKASKAASQRRWLSKNGNGDYFRGPEAVGRVQAWRRAHPGYWRRTTPPSDNAQVPEPQATNPRQSSCNVRGSPLGTLQDDSVTQSPAFVGLLSMVTGSTLQEEIAATTRQLLLRGRNILGLIGPESTLTTAQSAS